MYDVVALGELLIDFTPVRHSNTTYEQHAGGAPANVLVAAAGFGKQTCMVGKIGTDKFGSFLYNELANHQVGTQGIVKTNEHNTTLAFVHLDEGGERSFSFYRERGADIMLSYDEIETSILENTRIFHFGSVSMTGEPSRTTTLKAVQIAKSSGAVVTFDPNIRLNLWKSEEEAKQVILNSMNFVDILKISHEELYFITGYKTIEDGLNYLLKRYPISIILVTLGQQGCYYCSFAAKNDVSGFTVKSIDTTGAGDAFMGAFIGAFLDLEKKPKQLTFPEMEQIVKIANASGALATTKNGGIPSIPTRLEIMDLIERM